MRFTCAAETRATRCESSTSRRISTSHNRWLVQKEWPARAKERASSARLASLIVWAFHFYRPDSMPDSGHLAGPWS